jgi:hypothetical protein
MEPYEAVKASELRLMFELEMLKHVVASEIESLESIGIVRTCRFCMAVRKDAVKRLRAAIESAAPNGNKLLSSIRQADAMMLDEAATRGQEMQRLRKEIEEHRGCAIALELRLSEMQRARDALAAFVTDYIVAEKAAIEQWKKDYPRLPWTPDHEAMKRLERARAALNFSKDQS